MKFFSQSYIYDDPWPIVALAYFLRYPNPLSAHILSCDVVNRTLSQDTGNLHTTRLILKRSTAGNTIPKWLPKGIVPRTESWVLEELEVDPFGRQVSSTTRNLEHVKVMRVEEHVRFRVYPDNDRQTIQITEAKIVSGFGWGLTRKIEGYGLAKFKGNIERSREGVALIVALLRQSRTGLGMQTMGLGGSAQGLAQLRGSYSPLHYPAQPSGERNEMSKGSWSRLKSWFSKPHEPPSAP